jgi:hypothetical protein
VTGALRRVIYLPLLAIDVQRFISVQHAARIAAAAPSDRRAAMLIRCRSASLATLNATMLTLVLCCRLEVSR